MATKLGLIGSSGEPDDRSFADVAARAQRSRRGFIGVSAARGEHGRLLVFGSPIDDGFRGSVVEFPDATNERRLLTALVEGIEALPEAFVLWDEHDRLVISNERYRALCPTVSDLVRPGVSFETLVREGIRRGQFHIEGDPAEFLDERLSCHRAGIGYIEQQLGDGRWIQVTERRTASGGTASIRADISGLKAREDELRSAKAQAETAIAARMQLLAVVSHELRNPLNAILGLAEMLAADPMSERQRDLIDNMTSAAGSIRDLLDDLIDVGRSEIGRRKPSLAVTGLRPLLAETRSLAAALGRAKRLTVRLTTARALPPVRIDPSRLRQVLTNVVNNAVKFTPAGGRVTIDARPFGTERVRLSVRDTGPGIRSSEMGHLFKPFVRLDARSAGAGLGLAICKELCAVMDAEIGVKATAAGGACFFVDLRTEASVTGRPVSEPTGRPEIIEAPALRVLAIDDDRLNLLVVEGLLRQLGHRATLAGSSREALACLEDPFDLVLLDMSIGHVSGMEIVRVARGGRNRTTPFVAMTGDVRPQAVKAYLADGIAGVLGKPFGRGELAATLTAATSDIRQGDDPAARENRVRFGGREAGRDAFDPSRLTTMTGELGRDRVANIVAQGAASLSGFGDDVAAHLAVGDRPAALSVLHKIRAAAALLGLRDLVALARSAERTLERAEPVDTGLRAAIRDSISAGCEALALYSASLGSRSAEGGPARVVSAR